MHIYAVGDIHGHARKALNLLHKLPVAERDMLIFLGDYVDYGPDSRLVVDLLMRELRARGCRAECLMGNHDFLLASYLIGSLPEEEELIWTSERMCGLDSLANYAAAAGRAQAHAEFLRGLRAHRIVGSYMFSHVPRNGSEEFLGIWEEHRAQHPDSAVHVRGHKAWDRIDHPYEPLLTDGEIGADTSSQQGGPVSAVRLPDRSWFPAWSVRPEDDDEKVPVVEVSSAADVPLAIAARRASLRNEIRDLLRRLPEPDVGAGGYSPDMLRRPDIDWNRELSTIASVENRLSELPDPRRVLRSVLCEIDGAVDAYVVDLGSRNAIGIPLGAVTLNRVARPDSPSRRRLLSCTEGEALTFADDDGRDITLGVVASVSSCGRALVE